MLKIPTFGDVKIGQPKLSRWLLYGCVLANIVSLGAALALVFHLKAEDRVAAGRGCALSALGLVYWWTLHAAGVQAAYATRCGARLRLRFALRRGDVLDICNKAVSGVQALLSCATGAVVCAFSCTRDLLRTSHVLSEGYAWFGAAYFFYDIYSMYTVHVHMQREGTLRRRQKRPEKGAEAVGGEAAEGERGEGGEGSASFLAYCRHEPVIVMHHLFIGGFGFLVIVHLRGGLGDCVFGFVYLMELSTPFVSARGILSRLRLKATRAYLLNGLAMLFTFFLCRVASLPYVCLLYSRVRGLSYLEAIRSLPLGCKVSICILLLPQLYWFCLMSIGAVKVFTGRGGDRAPPAPLVPASPASPSPPDSQPTSPHEPRPPQLLSAGDAHARS